MAFAFVEPSHGLLVASISTYMQLASVASASDSKSRGIFAVGDVVSLCLSWRELLVLTKMWLILTVWCNDGVLFWYAVVLIWWCVTVVHFRVAAGTAHGLGIVDFVQRRLIYAKCTLNPAGSLKIGLLS